jgi:phosphoribosylformimino-5-aminoimidazole carboxamide ribotide isomerase
MILLPAMDLLAGRVVKLGGDHLNPERDYGNPDEIADRWISAGAKWLHVVDLDGALGSGSNDSMIDRILEQARSRGVSVQVGGGIRREDRISRFDADRIIVGTRAVEDPEWLSSMAVKFPDRLVVSIDGNGLDLLVNGWQSGSSETVGGILDRVSKLPVAALLYTNVTVEGRGKGVEWDPAKEIQSRSPLPIIHSGGISSLEDVRGFHDLGAYGIILGSAIYLNRFTYGEAASLVGE